MHNYFKYELYGSSLKSLGYSQRTRNTHFGWWNTAFSISLFLRKVKVVRSLNFLLLTFTVRSKKVTFMAPENKQHLGNSLKMLPNSLPVLETSFPPCELSQVLSIKRTKLSMWRGCFQLAISSNEILRHVINKLFVSTPCSFPFKLVMYSQLWQKVSNWTHLADFDTQSFQIISEQSKILRVELQWYQLCLNKELKTSDWNLKKKIK